jgi:hypothetical protein
MIPLIPIALKLATAYAPQLIGMLAHSDKAEKVAEAVVQMAADATGAQTPEEALARLERDPAMRLEFARITNERDIQLAEIDDRRDARMFGLRSEEIKAHTEQVKADVQDRDDARDMQKATRSRMPAILSVSVTLGFLVTLGLMMAGVVNPSDSPVVMMVLGTLTASFTQVLNFWLGSSDSSKSKTELLAKAPAIK